MEEYHTEYINVDVCGPWFKLVTSRIKTCKKCYIDFSHLKKHARLSLAVTCIAVQPVFIGMNIVPNSFTYILFLPACVTSFSGLITSLFGGTNIFETSKTTRPTTKRHIRQDLRLQKHICEELQSGSSICMYVWCKVYTDWQDILWVFVIICGLF